MRLLVGFSCYRKAMRRVKSDKLSMIIQRATRDPETEGLGKALRTKLRKIWSAPPELSVANPH